MSREVTVFGEEPPREQSCSHQDVLEMAGNRMPNGCVRTGFSFAASPQDMQKKNCHSRLSGTPWTQKHRTRHLPFVFTRLRGWNCPPRPAGVASLCERMRYRYSPITTLRGYRYKRPPFWRWHFISFWWGGRTSAQCRTPD